MYEAHYKLSDDPFRLRPRYGACFEHRSYKRAQSYLLYALSRGEGLLLVTGMPGTGKTSLVRDCSRRFTNQRVKFVELSSGNLDSEDVVYLIAHRLGLDVENKKPVERLAQLESALRSFVDEESRVILLIDEAQSLTDDALDEIKNLSNMDYKDLPLMQFFLVGQKSLKERLQQPELSQVMQRITAACELEPMSYSDTAEYIRHCLIECDWDGNPEISEPALQEIFANSGGIPRTVNLIASRLLLHGMVEDMTSVGMSEIAEVVDSLRVEGLLPIIKAEQTNAV